MVPPAPHPGAPPSAAYDTSIPSCISLLNARAPPPTSPPHRQSVAHSPWQRPALWRCHPSTCSSACLHLTAASILRGDLPSLPPSWPDTCIPAYAGIGPTLTGAVARPVPAAFILSRCVGLSVTCAAGAALACARGRSLTPTVATRGEGDMICGRHRSPYLCDCLLPTTT